MKRYILPLFLGAGVLVIVLGVFMKIMTRSHHTVSTTDSMKFNVQVVKSPKGQQAWILENHHSKVISLSLVFRNAGTKSDPKGKIGRAQLTEALLKEGAGDYNAQQLKRKLLENKMQLSSSCDKDSFAITVRFPSENLKPVIQLLGLILSHPPYGEESVNQERDKLLTDLKQSLHDEGTIAKIAMSELIYGQHPYGHTLKDVVTDLPGITQADIKEYQQKHWGRDALEITAVGDFTPKKLLAELDVVLKGLPEKAAPDAIEDVKLLNLGQFKHVPLDIPQTFIFFLQEGISASDPHFIQTLLVNRILGGGAFKSRLWDEVREKRGLAYHIQTSINNSDHVQLWVGIAGSKNETAEQVIELIRSHWKKLYDEGVTPEELNFAKDYLKGILFVQLDSTMNFCQILADFQHLKFSPNFINERNTLIDQVTLEDLNKSIKESLIKPENLTLIVVGPTAKKQNAS